MKWYKVWTSDLSAPIMLIKANTPHEALKKAREENRSYDLIEEYKQANKCEHFRRQKIVYQRTTPQGMRHVVERTVDRCFAFKYTPPCMCKGIKANCDFYPEKRNG
ncbi:MAG: hypothetical protein E7624_08655 [Ruminococcaceae bacterium]|nr:hypothetical protein [Oscillospiraceae bacterium]